MGHSTFLISADIVLTIALLAVQQPSSQGTVSEGKAQAGVTGRITIDGEPVSGARVLLTRDEGRGSAFGQAGSEAAQTDNDGRFRISRIRPGRFILRVASALGVLPAEGTQQAAGRVVVVGEGEVVDLQLALERGGVITGKVTFGDNQPIIGSVLSAQLVAPPGSQRVPATAQTDDRGVYRFYNLLPGEYHVVLSSKGFDISSTYYSDAVESGKPTPVRVSAGGEVSGIDFRLPLPPETFRITGRVIDAETGAPISGVPVLFRTASDRRFLRYDQSHKSNTSGRYAVSDVPPGKYIVSAEIDSNDPWYGVERSCEVTDKDVSEFDLLMHKGSSISGVVTIEGDASRVTEREWGLLKVTGVSSTGVFQHAAPVERDGRFTLNGLPPGKVRLRLNSSLHSFFVIRVERNGRVEDMTEIQPGLQITNVRVVVGHGTGDLHGRISFQNGTLQPGTQVVVYLVNLRDGRTWEGVARLVGAGHFRIADVPIGSYDLNARVIMRTGAYSGLPHFTKRIAIEAARTTTADVNLDLSTVR